MGWWPSGRHILSRRWNEHGTRSQRVDLHNALDLGNLSVERSRSAVFQQRNHAAFGLVSFRQQWVLWVMPAAGTALWKPL